MSEGKNKRRRKVAFIFHEPLTKVLPATAGSGARQHGEPEYNIFVFKKFLDLQVKNIDNLIFFR